MKIKQNTWYQNIFLNKCWTLTVSFYLKSSGFSNALWLLPFILDWHFVLVTSILLLKGNRSFIASHTDQNHHLHVKENKDFKFMKKTLEKCVFVLEKKWSCGRPLSLKKMPLMQFSRFYDPFVRCLRLLTKQA